MDEALVFCAIDISGRGFLACDLTLLTPKLGDFTTELVPEFFRAVAVNAGWTVHLRQMAGTNTHHIIESAFKAFGRAMSQPSPMILASRASPQRREFYKRFRAFTVH